MIKGTCSHYLIHYVNFRKIIPRTQAVTQINLYIVMASLEDLPPIYRSTFLLSKSVIIILLSQLPGHCSCCRLARGEFHLDYLLFHWDNVIGHDICEETEKGGPPSPTGDIPAHASVSTPCQPHSHLTRSGTHLHILVLVLELRNKFYSYMLGGPCIPLLYYTGRCECAAERA